MSNRINFEYFWNQLTLAKAEKRVHDVIMYRGIIRSMMGV